MKFNKKSKNKKAINNQNLSDNSYNKKQDDVKSVEANKSDELTQKVSENCAAVLNEATQTKNFAISEEDAKKILRAVEDAKQNSLRIENKLAAELSELTAQVASLSTAVKSCQENDEKNFDYNKNSLELLNALKGDFVILSKKLAYVDVDNSNENVKMFLTEMKEEFNAKRESDNLLFADIVNKTEKLSAEFTEYLRVNDEKIKEIICSVNGIATEIAQIKVELTEVNSANAELSEDINRLQDQMFKLEMVSVTEENEQRFESYHNLMLDEMCTLRKDFDSIAAKFDGCQNVASEEKINELSSSMDNIFSGLDGIMTKLAVSELSVDDPDKNAVEVSREKLSKSLDELKKDLSQLAEEISFEK